VVYFIIHNSKQSFNPSVIASAAKPIPARQVIQTGGWPDGQSVNASGSGEVERLLRLPIIAILYVVGICGVTLNPHQIKIHTFVKKR